MAATLEFWQDRPITDNQFENLPPDLKNKYIGFGVGLSDGQAKMIDSKFGFQKKVVAN